VRLEDPIAMPGETLSIFAVLGALCHTAAVRWTLGYYGLFVCLGLSTAVFGPTLLALASQTQTPLGQMGWLFLVGAAGQTVWAPPSVGASSTACRGIPCWAWRN
jgi:hypothetical protein